MDTRRKTRDVKRRAGKSCKNEREVASRMSMTDATRRMQGAAVLRMECRTLA